MTSQVDTNNTIDILIAEAASRFADVYNLDDTRTREIETRGLALWHERYGLTAVDDEPTVEAANDAAASFAPSGWRLCQGAAGSLRCGDRCYVDDEFRTLTYVSYDQTDARVVIGWQGGEEMLHAADTVTYHRAILTGAGVPTTETDADRRISAITAELESVTAQLARARREIDRLLSARGDSLEIVVDGLGDTAVTMRYRGTSERIDLASRGKLQDGAEAFADLPKGKR
jgi:hypothetical protein